MVYMVIKVVWNFGVSSKKSDRNWEVWKEWCLFFLIKEHLNPDEDDF